ncbi:MAG TPA: hypothetical protein DCP69_03175, partial [Candidatus Omnitrophica bacterium]|nr:hypothetical protein [Candidatus Omnitrophota bacterium]
VFGGKVRSYPNVYRVPGKELCDLLVVFEQHIVIFSDKHCEFPNSGDLDLDWARWYRRAIKKSAEELYGAERWIRFQRDRIFLDSQCTKRFPLKFSPEAGMKIHRIIVAHGAAARCSQELGGSGSLMVSSRSIGDDHVLGRKAGGIPFMVGQVDPAKGYVHVLDDMTLDVLLRTLDTVADFTAYLTKKEQFIQGGRSLAAAGEEELLAYYLTHVNADGEHDFVFDGQYNAITLDQGFWRDFIDSPERQRQLKANQVSYIWDHIIERFTQNFLLGTSHFISDTSLTSHEMILRFFAREPRTRRRMLMSAIMNMIQNTQPTWRRIQVLMPSRPSDPYFVFVLFPIPEQRSYDEYRTIRMMFLEICCRVVKLDFPDALDIVGFATETFGTNGRSEDAAYFDARLWTEELAAATRQDKETLNILTRPTRFEGVVRDYPDSDERSMT